MAADCVGEMIVGPKSTLFLDEISTGLDSSTTHLIVKCARNFVHMSQARPSTGGIYEHKCSPLQPSE